MSESWSSRAGDDPDDIDGWMAWRRAQLALSPEADDVARNLWDQGTWGGVDVHAPNPSDLTALGRAALGGAGPDPATDEDDSSGGDEAATPQRAPVASAHSSSDNNSTRMSPYTNWPAVDPVDPHSDPWVSEAEVVGRLLGQVSRPSFLDQLNHNPVVRGAAGIAGYGIGLPAGALRGGWHALEGIGHGLNLVGGLFFPEGRAAAWNEAPTATHDALQYGRRVWANPVQAGSEVVSAANRSLNPLATPIPDTATGAFGHELGIGANGGETLTNIAGFLALPEVAMGVKAARTFEATREANVAEMMGRGLDEPTARYLSKPYGGEGDHALVQKSQKSILGFKVPFLKEVPIPRWFMDGPLNVSKPRGQSQYDAYKYHYGVDSQFHGGRLPFDLSNGKGFSGRRLGFERYSDPGRTWARIPPIWKDYYAGVASGDALDQLPQDKPETPQ